MRRVLPLLILGLLIASPLQAQDLSPCPPEVRIPMNLFVAPPVCPDLPLTLVAEACGPCVDLLDWTFMPPGPIQVYAFMDPADCILDLCQRESLTIPIGQLAAGHHELVVEVRGTVAGPESTFCTVVRQDTVRFDVPLNCGSLPGPLPYTDVVQIGPPPPCATCPPPPICPSVEIPFRIAGHFPNTCYEFRGLELLPSPLMSPLPQPPVARVYVAVNDCLDIACLQVLVPWEAKAMLPGLPGGDYGMIVELAEIGWCDSTRTSDTLYTTIVPFKVAERCDPPVAGCFLHQWRHDPMDPACDTRVGRGTPGRLVFEILTFEPLSGLQGRFALEPPELRIAGLRAIGPTSGMHLLWEPLPDGASFVLFADTGAPIWSLAPCATCPPAPVPVLEVMVEPRPDVPIPPLTLLRVGELLASDSLGGEVPPCPTFAEIPPATICAGRSCDFNADGGVDVRDLVFMVRCLTDRGACPDSAAALFDCDRDGSFDLDDALCCARVILHHRMPDDPPTRPAPDLQVILGEPEATSTGVDLAVRIQRADLVGAARLAFAYTADRFDGAAVELLGDAAHWLQMDEAADGELVVGLIAAAPPEEMAGTLDLVLHFALAEGQEPSAEVYLTGSEFVGPDGMPLAGGSPTSVPQDGAAVFGLSAAWPNPFTREMRFVVKLTRVADADVGIFDLSGRRVASLHHGSLAAGAHTFLWDGTRSDGSQARDGVYFHRVRVAGELASRKLVLMRGE